MAKKYSDEELIEELQRLAEELGRSPSKRDMSNHGRYSGSIYQQRFGSWNNAKELLGLRTKDPKGKIPTRDLLEYLRKVEKEREETPTYDWMNREGIYSHNAYTRRFGSWNNALREAGLTPNKDSPTSYKEKELIDELIRLSNKLEKTPSYSDMNNLGKFSSGPYVNVFGSWNSAISEAGLEINQPGNNGRELSRELLEEELHRAVDKLGRVPTWREMNNFADFSTTSYHTYFGSWIDALKKVGYEPADYSINRSYPTGKEHWGWKGGNKRYYGGSWKKQREKCRERDDYQCQICGINEDRHIENFGRELEVHHIKPLRNFEQEEYDEANKLDNLVSLCRKCHPKVEHGEIPCPTPDEKPTTVNSIRNW